MLKDLEKKLNMTGLHILSEPSAIILFEMETDEGEKLTEMMCARGGSYQLNGPEGEATIYNSTFFSEMISAFEINIREQDIPVDYDHRMQEAAGWIKRLYLKDGNLWATIKWTPEGERKIRNGEYRYPSICYCDGYVNPRTGQQGKNVLISLAITNYPALKGTEPITSFNETDSIPSIMEVEEDKQIQDIERKENDLMDDEKMKELQEALCKANTEKEEATKLAEKAKAGQEEALKKLAEIEAQKAAAEAEKIAFERKTEYTGKVEAFTLKNADRAKTGEYILRSEQVEEVVNLLMELTPEQAEKTMKMFAEMPGTSVPIKEIGNAKGGEEPETVGMSDDEKAKIAMEKAKTRKEWSNPLMRETIYKEEEIKVGLRPAPAMKK